MNLTPLCIGRAGIEQEVNLTPLFSRLSAYRAWVAEAVMPKELETISNRLQRQQALGTDRFTAMIEEQLGRSIRPGRIGRPRRQAVPAEAD